MLKKLYIIGNEEERVNFFNSLPHIPTMLIEDEYLYDGKNVLVDTNEANSENRLVEILKRFMHSVAVYQDRIVVIP